MHIKEMKATFIAAMALMASVLITACSEKDDFIPEPTPTSVIVTGTVTTSSGKPLADIPVSIDYEETSYLGPHTTIHKAKGKTDSNGRYRLFFEPEGKKSPDGSDPGQSYNLSADLSGLPADEFIMPGDFDKNRETTYRLNIYKLFEQGENIDIPLCFPEKKEIKTDLKNFVADKSVVVSNTFQFGAQKETVRRDLDLDARGNGSVMIPAAIEETNRISVAPANSLEDLSEPLEFTVREGDNSPVVFDNRDALEACRFKLSLYTFMSFDGKEYDNKSLYSVPAPFDFLGFRITEPDGTFKPLDLKRYNYYDSIVWSSPEFPETLKIYQRENNGSLSVEKFTSQWGSYFFNTGFHKTLLKGYRNGRVICADSVSFELKDRDFLCFIWDECKNVSKPGNVQGIYCQLDGTNEYRVSPPVDIDGTKMTDIDIRIRGNLNKETLLNWQQIRLGNFLSRHLGKRVDYDKETIRSVFKHLSPDDEPGALYENAGTRAIVMHRLPSDYEDECFYIHAESK